MARFAQWHWSKAKGLQTEEAVTRVGLARSVLEMTDIDLDFRRSTVSYITPFITRRSSKNTAYKSFLILRRPVAPRPNCSNHCIAIFEHMANGGV